MEKTKGGGKEKKFGSIKFKQNSHFALLCHLNSSIFFFLSFLFFPSFGLN